MESQHGNNLDLKSDLDFPSLGSNVVPSSKRNSSPQQKTTPLQNSNKENSRSSSRGRGKKNNWKTVHVEFNNNSGGNNAPRYQQRGLNRPRFGSTHVTPKPSDDPPFEFSYRGYRSGSRSRIRRARGGSAPHHFGRPASTEPTTPASHSPTSDLSPTVMAIPYHPNYGVYAQQHHVTAAMTAESSVVDIEDAIRHQIEYYFSEENLIKDNYMRLNMTSEGFLSIQLISNFNKIKQFNTDIDTITRAIEASDKLEVVDGKMVRPVIDPLRWPLRTPLPPPVTSLMKNYVQPAEVIVAPLPNGTLYQEVVPELDAGDLLYQPVELVTAPVYQTVEEPIEHLAGYMGNMIIDEKAMYDYSQCFAAPELQDQQTLDQDPSYDYDQCYPVDSQPDEHTVVTEKQEDTQPQEVPKAEEKLTNGHHSEDDTLNVIVDTPPMVITDKVTFTRYATESKDLCQTDIYQQETMRCQQDSQDVGHYQHMFAYVSS